MPFSKKFLYNTTTSADGTLTRVDAGIKYFSYDQSYQQNVGIFEEQIINYSVSQTVTEYGLNDGDIDYREINTVSQVNPGQNYYGERPCYSKNTLLRNNSIGSNSTPISLETYDSVVYDNGVGYFMQTKLNSTILGYPEGTYMQSGWYIFEDRISGQDYYSTTGAPGGCNAVQPQCYSYNIVYWTIPEGYAAPTSAEVLRVSFDLGGSPGGLVLIDGEYPLSSMRAQWASGSLSTASKPAKQFLNWTWNRSMNSGIMADLNRAYAIFGNIITAFSRESGINAIPTNFFNATGGKGKG